MYDIAASNGYFVDMRMSFSSDIWHMSVQTPKPLFYVRMGLSQTVGQSLLRMCKFR